MQDKYRDKYEVFDLKARNAFTTKSATTSIIKYAYEYNWYQLKDTIVNSNMIGSECL